MKTNKTTLSFTKEELEILYSALNTYCVVQMGKSETWGNLEKYIEHGYKHDIWGEQADVASELQMRVFDARNRLILKGE